MSDLSRREFLRLSAASAATILMSGPSWRRQERDDANRQYRICVVGAGIAGLAAAASLRALGFSVTVLEARSRFGGRIHTDMSLGGPVDAGAWRLPTVKSHRLLVLAQLGKMAMKTAASTPRVLAYNGRRLSADEHAALNLAYNKMLTALLKRRVAQDTDISLQTAAATYLSGASLGASVKSCLEWRLAFDTETTYGTDPANLSFAAWVGPPKKSEGEIMLPGGMAQLVQRLSEGVQIANDTTVRRIDYDKAGVRVTTDREMQSFDRVIVTVPIGVLKKGAIVFRPALPPEKRSAIERIGVNPGIRIALRFDKPFWDAESRVIAALKDVTSGQVACWNYQVLTGDSILVAACSGPFARSLETAGPDKAVAFAMEGLRAVFGRLISDPIRTFVTHWNADPYSLGASATIPVGATADDCAALAEPIQDRLYFAGDAASDQYTGTALGAYTSGMQAAGRIAAIGTDEFTS